jgi:L-ascorbate metabolism protein UlaG (beta-lactamase superfamily)
MTLFPRHAEGLRRQRMRASPHYRDGRFFNPYPSSSLPLGQQPRPDLKAFLFGGEDRVPAAALPSLDPLPQWTRPPETGLRATWLGHATVLIEIDGRVILTDPVWGQRASPLSFLGPKRFQPVPVAIAALPKLDAVLISHDHYDHLDHATIRALLRRDVPFITSLGVGMHLEAWGVPPARITELDWWESTDVCPGLAITAAPAHHFSGRRLNDRNATLWSSFVLQGDRHSVFFSGDSGLSAHFAEIGRRLGSFDLVMMEVGAYHSSWASVHLGPDNALEAWRQLGSGRLLPIHWGTFNLAMHPWYEPAEVLLAAQPEGLIMPRLGQATEPARAGRPEPWWRPARGGAAVPVFAGQAKTPDPLTLPQ